jgi:hypothetical protein
VPPWSDSFGLRFKRPQDASPERSGFGAASPWIDADALYVRTGGLDRFGFTLGAGVSFPLVPDRTTWLGPFVRYMQIVQPDREGFDDTDAKVLLLGLNLEIRTNPLAPPVLAPMAMECPYCAPAVVPVIAFAPDRDQDSVADSMALPRADRGAHRLFGAGGAQPDALGSAGGVGAHVPP